MGVVTQFFALVPGYLLQNLATMVVSPKLSEGACTCIKGFGNFIAEGTVATSGEEKELVPVTGGLFPVCLLPLDQMRAVYMFDETWLILLIFVHGSVLFLRVWCKLLFYIQCYSRLCCDHV